MTRLARGAKWGMSASPPNSTEPVAAPSKLGFSRDANAATPMPLLAWPNNCRRVRMRSLSRIGSINSFLILSYRFIHVEDGAGNEGPGRKFGRIVLGFGLWF